MAIRDLDWDSVDALSDVYLTQFPIPETQLPPRLYRLLEPVDGNPGRRVDVASRYDNDQYGPNRECLHMVMALVPKPELSVLGIPKEARNGVVSSSTPHVTEQGDLADFTPSVSGLDYIVASWGDNYFYGYNLAEKVWMALGLSPRCLGGDEQKVIFDDLSLPEFRVVEGEISTEYYFFSKRNVCWTMSNEYLRRYLWMRGAYGVRVFFYEALLPDCPDLRAVMEGEAHVRLKPRDGWYELAIREHKGRLLIQLWASVVAVAPQLSPEPSANGLVWPGVAGPMTDDRANAPVEMTHVYLDDRFLERYEQSSFFGTTPGEVDGRWYCSPSYRGQWSFTECVRVGRNLIKVPLRELYQPKPDREIKHAHDHALDPAQAAEFNHREEHIVSKTARFVDQLLDLGDRLEVLSKAVGGVPKVATAIVGLSRAELRANGWLNYPKLLRLAQVAPLSMTEQAFLSRCKDIHELWQRIPDGFLRNLLVDAGHTRSELRKLGSLKLLQALLNIVERLNGEGERVDAFGAGAEPGDLTTRNGALVALFVNNDFRLADAHNAGGVLEGLERLGFDTAALNQGYGPALDHVFDGVINAFSHLNAELVELLSR